MKAYLGGSESVCEFGGSTGRENGGDAFRFIIPVSCEPEVGCDLSYDSKAPMLRYVLLRVPQELENSLRTI